MSHVISEMFTAIPHTLPILSHHLATPTLLAEDALDTVGKTSSKWTHGITDWFQSDAAKTWLIFKPLQIIAIIIAVLIVRGVLNRLIDKGVDKHAQSSNAKAEALARANLKEGESLPARVIAATKAQQQRRQARMKTLAGVAKSAVAVVVWAFGILNILKAIGMDVGPLVASAGVIGVALGFGAQSLVKDFLAGICMLLEDQFGVGDEVNLATGITGTVEELSLRLTTVRDVDGVLWYVRNGEILRVGNSTDQFSVARLEIPVAHSADYDEAATVIREAAAAACHDEAIASFVINEPIFKGISDFGIDHIVYRVVINTIPGKHWDVNRYVKARIIAAMRTNGIPVPYPYGIGGSAPTSTTALASEEAGEGLS